MRHLANFTMHSVIPETMTPETECFLFPRLGHAGVQGGRGLPLCRGLFGGGPLGGQLLRLLCRSWWTSSSRARLAHFWAEAPP